MKKQLLTLLICNFIFVSTTTAADGGVLGTQKTKSTDSTAIEQPKSKISNSVNNSPDPIITTYQQILSVNSNSLDLIDSASVEQPKSKISDAANNSSKHPTISAYLGLTTIFLLFIVTAIAPFFKEEVHRQTVVSSRNITLDPEIRAEVIAIIEANIADPDFDMSALAKALGRRTEALSHYLRKYAGSSFTALRIEVRMQRAKELLLEGLSIGDIADNVGYKDIANFSRAFKRYTTMTPSDYRNNQKSGAE